MRHVKGRVLEAAAVLAAFATAAALTFAFQGAGARGFYFLFAVPVAVAARRFGIGAGVAMSAGALGVVGLHSHIAGVGIGPAEFVLRAVTLVAIAVLARPERRTDTADTPDRPLSDGVAPQVPRHLTPRELEVLRLLALGHTNAEIADQLYLSVRTVESHRARLQRKLMRRGRSELTRYALETGLIEPSERSEPQRAEADPPPRGGSLESLDNRRSGGLAPPSARGALSPLTVATKTIKRDPGYR